jgi:predicted transcriptional regulator
MKGAQRMGKGLFGRVQQELEAREKVAGLTMADVLQLPAAERELVNWIVRSGEVSEAAIVTHLGQAASAQSLLTTLLDKGFIRAEVIQGEAHYSAHFAPRRKRALPEGIWQALTDKLQPKAED